MSVTLSPLVQTLVQKSAFKDYLIFRVDEGDDHLELADESALEAEAARYADLIDEAKQEPGVHYEVRHVGTGALLHTTADPQDRPEEVPWRPTAT